MNIGIIGTGAFSLALASIFDRNNFNVIMWSKFSEEINELNNKRISNNLESFVIPNSIKFTNTLEDITKNVDLIVIAIPSNYVYDTILELKKYYNNQHICIASKGIEESSGRFLHDIVGEILNTDKIGIISGPSFAIDIVREVPVGVTLASKNMETTTIIKKHLSNNYFKISVTDDMIGVSICGCIKNIIAIAAGMIDGMGYPISTTSLLITLALNDVKHLIKKFNGNEKSILELAGVGDIILSCTSVKSRNYSFGKLIGQTNDKQVINNYVHNNTIEGLNTLININKNVDNLHFDTPFINKMIDIILNGVEKDELIHFIVK